MKSEYGAAGSYHHRATHLVNFRVEGLSRTSDSDDIDPATCDKKSYGILVVSIQ